MEKRHFKQGAITQLKVDDENFVTTDKEILNQCEAFYLFNQSLVTRTFPSLWKFGKVSALFKKGDRCDPNNYRPITVLPTLSKILEKAVHNQLYYFLNDNKIITSKQFGFRPKLSTNTALTHFTDNVLLNMDSGRLTGAVFLDLSKAFDTVDHNLLLHKLKSVGLSEDTVNWFQSYLANRKQRTSVGDTRLCCCTNNCWGLTRKYIRTASFSYLCE